MRWKFILVVVLLFSSFIIYDLDVPEEILIMPYNIADELIDRETQLEVQNDTYIAFFDNEREYRSALKGGYVKKYDSLRAITFEGIRQLDADIRSLSTYNQSVPLAEIPDSISLDLGEYSDQIGIHNMDTLYADGYNGSTMKVGVIDTGADFTVPYLSHIKNFTIKSFEGSYQDHPDDHGTQVVSNIAGYKDGDALGLAVGAEIFVAEMGTEKITTIAGDFIGAFEWMMENNVTVINTSWGGPASWWEPIVKRLYQNGIVVVGAIGNEGEHYFNHNNDPFTATGPGSSPYGIAVGSITHDGGMAGVSSEGPTYSYVAKPDFVSLGVRVRVASEDGITERSGTSFASPLIAGGIAVLIEGMQELGIYSPTAVKTSLMTHGNILIDSIYNITWDEQYLAGAGLPDFSATWDDLKENGSASIHITPTHAPYDYMAYHPRGSDQQLYAWVYNTDFSNITFSVTGNISSILVVGNLINSSQMIPVRIQSTNTTTFGTYTGNVRISNGLRSSSINISIIVETDFKGKILFDIQYTHYDDFWNHLHGIWTEPAANHLWRQGYLLAENDAPLTQDVLNTTDILWLPNFLHHEAYREGVYSVSDQEIIIDYINNGGKVFIDFYGYLLRSGVEWQQYSYLSTDINALNRLIGEFNINAAQLDKYDEIVWDSIAFPVSTLNNSDITAGLDHISHVGNYLTILDDNDMGTMIIAGDGDFVWDGERARQSVVTQDVFGGGKVVVSSNPALRDPMAVDGNYSGQNIELFDNLIKWLNEDVDMTMRSFSRDIPYDGLVYYSGGENLSISYKIEDSGYQELYLVQDGYNYSFSLPDLGIDALYTFNVSAGEKYMKREYKLDILYPVLEGDKGPTNIDHLPFSSFYDVTERFPTSFSLVLNPVIPAEFIYKDHILEVIFDDVTLEYGTVIYLYIYIFDYYDRKTFWGPAVFNFQINTTTSTPPTSEYYNTFTPTTSIPSSSTFPVFVSSETDIPFIFLPVMIIPIIFIRRKK